MNDDDPIFYHQILQDIGLRLARPQPGLIVVNGPVGSGRTHFLWHLAATAGKLGYRVLGTKAEPAVIEPSTTFADMRRRLQSLAGTQPTSGSRPLTPPGMPEATMTEQLQITALLSRMAPILVAIDGFRPCPALSSWFTGELGPWLRASQDQVAVVIADRPAMVASMAETADFSVTLGSLDPGEVRAYLISASAGFSPELTAAELDAYVRAAVSQPAVLSALLTVFRAYCQAPVEVLS